MTPQVRSRYQRPEAAPKPDKGNGGGPLVNTWMNKSSQNASNNSQDLQISKDLQNPQCQTQERQRRDDDQSYGTFKPLQEVYEEDRKVTQDMYPD